MPGFARGWEASKLRRGNIAAQSLDYWFRHTYGYGPTDERYQSANPFQMEDEWHARKAYAKLLKGEPLDEVFESDESEDDILANLDNLPTKRGEQELPAPAPDDWIDVPEEARSDGWLQEAE
jgi:hypothetical protein